MFVVKWIDEEFTHHSWVLLDLWNQSASQHVLIDPSFVGFFLPICLRCVLFEGFKRVPSVNLPFVYWNNVLLWLLPFSLNVVEIEFDERHTFLLFPAVEHESDAGIRGDWEGDLYTTT